LKNLAETWRKKATESREESERIRGTVKAVTGAEERCLTRAEIWDACASELDGSPLPPPLAKWIERWLRVNHQKSTDVRWGLVPLGFLAWLLAKISDE
jgi:hypothetical protein